MVFVSALQMEEMLFQRWSIWKYVQDGVECGYLALDMDDKLDPMDYAKWCKTSGGFSGCSIGP